MNEADSSAITIPDVYAGETFGKRQLPTEAMYKVYERCLKAMLHETVTYKGLKRVLTLKPGQKIMESEKAEILMTIHACVYYDELRGDMNFYQELDEPTPGVSETPFQQYDIPDFSPEVYEQAYNILASIGVIFNETVQQGLNSDIYISGAYIDEFEGTENDIRLHKKRDDGKVFFMLNMGSIPVYVDIRKKLREARFPGVIGQYRP